MSITPDPVQMRLTAYWDRWAAEYDGHQMGRLARQEERAVWERVWWEVLPEHARDLLDVGTGSGNVALSLARPGLAVTGVDLSGGMLARARAKAEDHPCPPHFVLGDAVDPPLPPGSVDAIVSRYLLWTLRDAPAALARWHALLRPGGVLVAVDGPWFAHEEELPRGTARQDHFAAAYDADAFARLPFGRAGVEEIARQWTAAGFVDVRADPLPEVLALDRAHGVAPGHAPQLQYRLSARRPG
ncbi:class I SAM-dependent methyltransferase [Brachybacterium sp. YJGR34]|uniref:class I SAM-dependent methyltransferase n=1 Tax=Brachybacterium sp. YJGR34 TaxID=2059911 RepID=UPI001E3FAD5F|nr:class I SAM-dependent methyltransferase [Brachybacterium sp. YJGR34]